MNKPVILLLLIIFSTTVSQAQNMVFPAIQGYVKIYPPDYSFWEECMMNLY